MRLVYQSPTKIESASDQPDVLWGGGPPPDDAIWGWVPEFLADVHEMMSLSGAMRKHGVSVDSWNTLLACSPWVCERVNMMLDIKKQDVELATIQAAIGHTVTDDDGNIIRRGRDPVAAKYLLEREERRSGVLLGVSGPQVAPAIDDALTALRRQHGLLQVHPWRTYRPDGSVVFEVGKMDANQLHVLAAAGVVIPNTPEVWFVEVAPDRRTVEAVRDQRWARLIGDEPPDMPAVPSSSRPAGLAPRAGISAPPGPTRESAAPATLLAISNNTEDYNAYTE